MKIIIKYIKNIFSTKINSDSPKMVTKAEISQSSKSKKRYK